MTIIMEITVRENWLSGFFVSGNNNNNRIVFRGNEYRVQARENSNAYTDQ